MENFAETLERFRHIISECPHHGFSEETLLSTFYRGALPSVRKYMDGASNGNFLSRDVESGWELLENMSVSSSVEDYNRQAPHHQGNRKDMKVVHVKLNQILSATGQPLPSEEEEENDEDQIQEGMTEEIQYVQGTNQPRYQGNYRPNQGNYNNYRQPNQQSNYRGNQAGSNPEPFFPNKPPLQTTPASPYRPPPSGFQPQPNPAAAQQTNTTVYQQHQTTDTTTPDITTMIQQLLQGQTSMQTQITNNHTELTGKIDTLNTKFNQLNQRLTKVEQQVNSPVQVRPQGQLPSTSVDNPRQPTTNQKAYNVSAITISKEKEEIESTKPYNFAEDNLWLALYGRRICPPYNTSEENRAPDSTPLKYTVKALTMVAADQKVARDSNVQVGGARFKAVKAVTTTVQDAESPPQARKETSHTPEGLGVNCLDKCKIPLQEELSTKELNTIDSDKGKYAEPIKKDDHLEEASAPPPAKNESNSEVAIQEHSEPDEDSHEESDEEFIAQYRLNKNKAEDMMVTLSLPWIKKLEDPGIFSVPCSIGKINFPKCMCDLGAAISIMPASIAAKLGLTNFKPGKVTLQLADQSSTECLGILAEVPVVVDNIIVPTDFAIVYMQTEPTPPLLLGRPFLASTNALIDCTSGTVQFRFSNFRKPIYTREGKIIGGNTLWDDSDESLESLSEDSESDTLKPYLADKRTPENTTGALMNAEEVEEPVEKHSVCMVNHRGRRRRRKNIPAPPPLPVDEFVPSRLKPKKADIGPLLINCSIEGEDFLNCICDTGASISVMPSQIAWRLKLQGCKTKTATLTMADNSTTNNCIVIYDVPVIVQDVLVPTDFAVVDMNFTPRNPLILGRPFLLSTDALLDMSRGTVTLRFDCVSFKRNDAASILIPEAFMVNISIAKSRKVRRAKGVSSRTGQSSQKPNPRKTRRNPESPPLSEWLEKKGDPGTLNISCSIKDTIFPKCLCDTGATLSIMPYTVAERLGLISSIPCSVRVRMADNTLARNHGIISDVRVLLDGVTIPTDFIVMHIEREPDYDLLFGRAFLHTAGAQLDMDTGRVTLALRPGDQTATTSAAATINISSRNESPSEEEEEEEEDQVWDPEIERSPLPSPPPA